MKLHVQLLEGRNLRPPDRSCRAYARMKLGSTTCKSSLSSSSSSSIASHVSWFEDFIFNVEVLGSELRISFWHHDRFNDVFLGRFRLPISLVLGAENMTLPASWYPLQRRSVRSKTAVTGEINAGFTVFGRIVALPGSPFSDKSCLSSVSSTLTRTVLSGSHSSESSELSESLDWENDNNSSLGAEETDSHSNMNIASILDRVSGWISNALVPILLKENMKESMTKTDFHQNNSHANLEDRTQPTDQDTMQISNSFFEDDGNYEASSVEEMPPSLGGGILINATYSVSAKIMNGILFKPGSQFQRDLREVQKTVDYLEEPWIRGDDGKLKRTVTYTKAPTKLVKAAKATENQIYSRADKKGFVVDVSASTPDVPYGKTFCTDIQYCIFAGADVNGEKTSYLRVTWSAHFLKNTIMKGIIESGIREGLHDSYREFVQVMGKYVRPLSNESAAPAQIVKPQEDYMDTKILTFQSKWQTILEYLSDVRICVTVISTLLLFLHMYISKPCPKHGFELWKLDLPDTLCEFIISAILGVQIEHMIIRARRLLGAKIYKGSDHGVKAKGVGWVLAVTLENAENIPAFDGIGVPDPFVVFTCNGKSRTSSIKLNTFNPVWKERFEFDATEEAPSTMNVEVFDFEGPFTDAESVGYGEINFLKQSREELADLWVFLEGKNARAAGCKIHLRVVLVNTTEESNNAVHYIQKVEKEVGSKITGKTFVKNVSFQKLFSLPSEEFLVNDFSCSIKRKFLLQGRLFLSPRILAFYSNVFGHKTKFIILWEDIEEIREASHAFGSMSILLNRSILIFTKRGRATDARDGAKSMDEMGRFKFQFTSFIHYKPAFRTMMVLWNYRTLSPGERMDLIADINERDESSESAQYSQSDDSEMFLGVDEANLCEVYSTRLPVSVMSAMQIYEEEKMDERVAEKTGRLNYFSTPWESLSDDDNVQQRRVRFRLSNQICLFGTNVTCIQQKTKRDDGHALFVDELLTLHDVPFGDNFQIRIRKEMEDVSSTPPSSVCKVLMGVAWHKSTIFQSQISKNIFEKYTQHLKRGLDVIVQEINNHT